ncbi:MAG: hypothetical protein KatS3mg014_2518 [Actinomycetota bacterium]|nr:MAG: hypothetical protein KatS3mg014_2487 [Actinomycetota bacterium]GIV00903.1 MAG: hypothetical protein KatS3mg014_2518 [Actinomycetota bacterium]
MKCRLCDAEAVVVRFHPSASPQRARTVERSRGWALDEKLVRSACPGRDWLVGLCEAHAALDRVVTMREAARALGLTYAALDRRMRRHPDRWPRPFGDTPRLWWLVDIVRAAR